MTNRCGPEPLRWVSQFLIKGYSAENQAAAAHSIRIRIHKYLIPIMKIKLFERLCSPEILQEAWISVKSKKSAGDIDGISVKDFTLCEPPPVRYKSGIFCENGFH